MVVAGGCWWLLVVVVDVTLLLLVAVVIVMVSMVRMVLVTSDMENHFSHNISHIHNKSNNHRQSATPTPITTMTQ